VALALAPAVAGRSDVGLRRTAGGGATYGVRLSVWAGIRGLFWRFAAESPESTPRLLLVVLAAGAAYERDTNGAWRRKSRGS
jgi:hypothetical protein